MGVQGVQGELRSVRSLVESDQREMGGWYVRRVLASAIENGAVEDMGAIQPMMHYEDHADKPHTRDDELASLTARAIARNAADRKRIMSVLEKVAKGECWYGSIECKLEDRHQDMCASCLASYLVNGGE